MNSYTKTVARLAILGCVLGCSLSAGAWDEDDELEGGDGQAAADQPVGASDEGLLAIQSFQKPDNWQISLFAAEPALANPVALTVDHRGRLFVCETFRQDRGVTDNRAHDREWLLADLAAQSVQDRIDYHLRLLGSEAAEYTAHDDRIRMLQDTDADGVADTMTVFAEGFNKLEEGTGAGVLVRGDTAYYTCIPKLWALTDTDGDGQAEQRVVLHDGYGVRVAFRGHDSHGLIMGPDGRLYFSIGDRGYNLQTPSGQFKNVESGAVFRCELDGSGLEVFATGLRNPQELAFDDYGYLFTGDNNSDSGDKARWVNVMEGGDTGWRMMYQYLPDRGPFNREKIWHPYSEETPAYIVPPIANIGDGPSGLACYPGTGLTGDFANCFFMVDFRGGPSNSGVRLIRSQPKGAFWEIERSEQPLWNILATDIEFGPDGRLWVCDWVMGWIGEGKGRIYRVEDPEAQQQDIVREVESLLAEGFEDLPPQRLEALLRHLDRRIRLEAQWELAQRGLVEPFERVLADASAGTLARLHAVWGLGHATRLQPALREQTLPILADALQDSDVDVRATATSVLGDLRVERLAGKFVELILDEEPRVQYAASLAAGKLQLSAALDNVCALLAANADQDPGLRHAGIMAFTGMPANVLQLLAGHDSASVRLAAVVGLRKQHSGEVVQFLGDPDPRVQTEAARAIHDVPELQVQLPVLAEVALLPEASDALVHRVLNANFRLGGEQAATRVAAVAADPARTELMRVEALAMLAAWAEPGPLDRVMNRYQPAPERSAAAAQLAFKSQLNPLLSTDGAILRAAVDAAIELQVGEAASFLREVVEDAQRPRRLRQQAINGLVRLEGADVQDLLVRLTSDSQGTVRATALAQLAKLAPEAALPSLTKAVDSADDGEAQLAWDTLADIESPTARQRIERALDQLVAGDIPPAQWLNVIEAAEKVGAIQLPEKLAAFREQAAENVAEYRECQSGGDVEAGRKLFFEKTELSCVRCHQVKQTGGEVGPDLSEIAKTKDARYLLEAIVAPNAKIAENFGTVVLLTEDDEVLTGIVRRETEQVIELIDADGKITEVDPEAVVARKQGQSAMPADLVKFLSRRELRDLVAYLASLK